MALLHAGGLRRQRIRLLIPAEFDGYYNAVRRGLRRRFDGSKLVDRADAIEQGDFGLRLPSK
jgi:hypothetical protein